MSVLYHVSWDKNVAKNFEDLLLQKRSIKHDFQHKTQKKALK